MYVLSKSMRISKQLSMNYGLIWAFSRSDAHVRQKLPELKGLTYVLWVNILIPSPPTPLTEMSWEVSEVSDQILCGHVFHSSLCVFIFRRIYKDENRGKKMCVDRTLRKKEATRRGGRESRTNETRQWYNVPMDIGHDRNSSWRCV